tara:strand:+ start:1300 stop:1626 length:327 start_codon:yes stop_codon:yes gene_type:complete
MTTVVYDAIEDMTEGQLDDLLSAIKDRLDELRGERPEINIGDVVQFDVRKATLTGVVEKTTDKRATVKLSTVEGTYTIDTKQVEIISAGVSLEPTMTTETLEAFATTE